MTKVRKYRPRDSWGRFKKATAQVSGAALGFITDNVPGLFEGAELAGDLYEAAYPLQFEEERKPFSSSKNSMYTGKISSGKMSMKSFMEVCAERGAAAVVETFGRVEDPNTCFIHHSSWFGERMSYVMRLSLIRKLFQKAGIQISSRSEELPLEYNVLKDLSQGFRLVFTSISPAGVLAHVTYECQNDKGLSGIVDAFVDFASWFDTYLDDGIDTEAFSLALYQRDTTNTGAFIDRCVAMLYLQNEFMSLQMSSELKFQNRTAGDTAGAGADVKAELDRVDCQPLIVRLYDFRNGDMRLKHNTTTNVAAGAVSNLPLAGQNNNGLRLFRATVLDTSYQNRPGNNLWINCVGTKGFILQPGEMKKVGLSYTCEGKLGNLLKKLKAQVVLSGIVNGTIGHSQLLCFEEKMRTIGTNPVTVHYERSYRIGCYSNTTKPAPIQPVFSTGEVNGL